MTPTNNSFAYRYRRYYEYVQPILADPVVRSYFSLVASLLLITFLIIFAISPTINIILGLRRKIDDQQRIITALEQKIDALVTAQSVYTQVEAKIPLLDQALPDRSLPQVVMEDIITSASVSGVAVSSLQFKPIAISTESATVAQTSPIAMPGVTFSLSVAGSQVQLRDFLGKLEGQLRYTRIQGLVMMEPQKIGENMTADLSAIGYYDTL